MTIGKLNHFLGLSFLTCKMRRTPALPILQGFFEIRNYSDICERALNTMGSPHR